MLDNVYKQHQRSVFSVRTARCAVGWLVGFWVGVAGAEDGRVVGLDGFPHAVASVSEAITYYREAFGYELVSTIPPAVDGKIGANVYDRELQTLMNVAGAYYRIATLRRPGDSYPLRLFELINNQTLVTLRGERQGSANLTEVGGSALRLHVADVSRVIRSLRNQYLGDILATDGGRESDGNRFVIRDDDGFLVQLISATAADKALDHGSGMTLTTADLERKLHFYRDLLGFQFRTGEWASEPSLLAALGADRGQVRRTEGVVPGTDVVLEILEFAGLEQRRYYPGVMGQAGVGWLSLVVRDVDELTESLVKERIRIVTTALKPVDFRDSRRIAVRDPDGVLVELIERRVAVTDVGR